MASKIACVVLNYRDADECIKYVKWAENLDVYDYIILVDNNSPDDSFTKLKVLQNDKIKVYKTDKNGGYGYGNNFGVNIASSIWGCDIAFISNPDVSYSKKSILGLIAFMNGNADCSIISSIQYNGFTKTTLVSSAWKVPTYNTYVLGSLFVLKRLLRNEHYNLIEDYQKVDCVAGAFLGVRIKDFSVAGGYDEGIFLYCEESTLGYRMRKHGFKTYIATKEKYYHYESTSISKSYTSSVSRKKLLLQSRMYYLNKYLKINRVQKVIAQLCFKISIIEELLKPLVRIFIPKSQK